jgi:DtxR family Mn-dependent transcriptional regulator
MVHYLLTIHKLKEDLGYARLTDIAKEMKLSKATVSIALTNLLKKNLILENNKFYSLSDTGHDKVHNILSSRTLLYYFLKDILNVNEKTAHRDSCLIEHLISEETREKFFLFMKDFYNSKKNKFNFKDYNEFVKLQVGDSYLSQEEI